MKYHSCYATVLINGEPTQKRFYGKTLAEAQKKRDKFLMEYEAGLLVLLPNTPFRRYGEEYLETYIRPAYDKRNYENLQRIMKKVWLDPLGNLTISDIRSTHLQKCLNNLDGYSKSMIDKAMLLIHGVFKVAMADGSVLRDPTLTLRRPSAVTHERRALTDTERKLFVQAAGEVAHGEFFLIMLACGLRPGEVRALTWNDINDGMLTVRGAIKNGTMTKGEPKTSAGVRTIPMPDYLTETLSRLRKTPGYIFGGARPFTPQHVRRMWRSVMRKMDILAGAKTFRNKITVHSPEVGQDLTPYYLRHTYATSLAENGVDIKTAQYLLGHSDIKMTMKVYTHVTPKMIEAAAEKIRAGLHF